MTRSCSLLLYPPINSTLLRICRIYVRTSAFLIHRSLMSANCYSPFRKIFSFKYWLTISLYCITYRLKSVRMYYS